MNMKFEQLFYGRGAGGYGVLGTSPGGQRFAARVESLCSGVGTPDGGYGGEPFLLSAPEGDFVVMACGRRGAPDSMGRGTLFFHVLVAPRSDLEATGTDAFALFEQGAFVARIPEGKVEAVSIDVRAGKRGATGTAAALPAVIRAPEPVPETVRALAGGKTNQLAWTTYAFQVMDGFGIQAVPPRTALPHGMNEYDASGILIRTAAPVSRPVADIPEDRGATVRRMDAGTREIQDAPPSAKTPSSLLKASLLANVLLAAVCAALWFSRPSSPTPSAPSTETLSSVRQAEIERAAVERYRAGLVAAFPADDRIGDFEETVKALPWYDDIYGKDSSFPKVRVFLDKAASYVRFANDNILSPDNERKSP